MNKVVAVIPARKESGELENKNLLPFADSNLLINKIRQLKQVERINTIVVSSEDDEILEYAVKEGVVGLKRPLQFADKQVPFGKFVRYIAEQIETEHILWGCCTSPFVEADVYNKALDLYFQKLKEGYDSLITVQLQKRFMLDANGSLNFRRGLEHKNSEELPELYLFTNGITLAPRQKIIEWNYSWGHIPYMMRVNKFEGIDIRDKYDYELAKLVSMNKEKLYEC